VLDSTSHAPDVSAKIITDVAKGDSGTKLRSLRIALGLLLLGIALLPGAAQASGFSPGHLTRQGWHCYYFGPTTTPSLPAAGVYCMPPGDDMATAVVNAG
jgi:hypothetical protein